MIAITVVSGKTTFVPGETIQGNLSWKTGPAPRAIEVRLFWHTEGKGTRDAGVVASNRMANPGPQGDNRPFRFTLPPAPWSFSGSLISLAWGIEAILEPGEESCAVEITVSPTGEEIRLPRLES